MTRLVVDAALFVLATVFIVGMIHTRKAIRTIRTIQARPTCESCGAEAHVPLDDGSTWCLHATPPPSGHDHQLGWLP